MLGEPNAEEPVKKWSAKIGSLDAFVFIVAEYNHSITGALKNALDLLRDEWNNKAAGIVSYGSTGGARAAEHLRGICGELMMADVRDGAHPFVARPPATRASPAWSGCSRASSRRFRNEPVFFMAEFGDAAHKAGRVAKNETT